MNLDLIEFDSLIKLYDTAFEIEVGFGKSNLLIDLAKSNSDKYFIGIEVNPKFCARMIWLKEKYGLENLKVICADAKEIFIQIPTNTIERIHVYFPSPYNSAFHKDKLFCYKFINNIYRILRPDGICKVITDDNSYAKQIQALFFIKSFLPNRWTNLTLNNLDNRFVNTPWEKKYKKTDLNVMEFVKYSLITV